MNVCGNRWHFISGGHDEWHLNANGDDSHYTASEDSSTGAGASEPHYLQAMHATFAAENSVGTRTDDQIVVPTIWGFIMALGLFGNLLVAYVMVRFADRSATNCFVVNLALTDLAFTVVVIPLTMIHYVLPSWNLGAACCKFLMYTIYVSIGTTN